MEKLNKKQIREITKKLKPFWKKHRRLETEFRKKEEKLDKEMNKKLDLDVELEFFYSDGGCVGIGAVYHKDRKHFPLIHDTELDSN